MTVQLIRAPGLYAGVPYAYASVGGPAVLVFTAGACPLGPDGGVVGPGDWPRSRPSPWAQEIGASEANRPRSVPGVRHPRVVAVAIDRLDDEGDSYSPTADASGACGTEDADTRETLAEQADSAVRAARTVDYQATVEAVYRAYAIDEGCARVRETEEIITTPAMRRIESEDPTRHLAGLDNRLKGKDRLTEKVVMAVNERGHTVEEAIGRTHGIRSSTKESTAGGESPRTASYSRFNSTPPPALRPRRPHIRHMRSCGEHYAGEDHLLRHG